MERNAGALAIASLLGTLLSACSGSGGEGGIGGVTLRASAVSATRIALSWTEPENASVNPYVIARNDANSDAIVSSTSALSYVAAGLDPSTRYCFVIRHPLLSYPMSNTACATTPADASPPTVPTGLTVTIVSPAAVDLAWNFASDEDRVVGYNIYRDGMFLDTTTAIIAKDTPAIPGSTHCFSVSSFDPSDNESAASPEVCTTLPPDNENPSIPSDVVAAYSDADGQSTITLTWTAAIDNGRVVFYRVFLNGRHLTDTDALTYEDLNPTPDSDLCYAISAVDSAGNESSQSALACARVGWLSTTIAPDTFIVADIALDANDIPHIAYKKRLPFTATADYALDYVVLQRGQAPAPLQLDTTMMTYWGDAQTVAITVANGFAVHIVHKVSRGGRMLPEDIRHVEPSLTPIGNSVIEQTDDPLHSVSLVTDSLGVVHACLTLGGRIIYANNGSGVWVFVDMATLVPGVAGWDCSIAVDSNGALHMSYLEVLIFDPSAFDLMYLTNASGEWTLDRLDVGNSEVASSFSTSIAVDGDDNIHIAYHHDFSTKDLEYATNASGSWVSTTIDSQGDVGRYGDIAIDPGGFVHIIYQAQTSDSRLEKYATNRSGTWETAILANADAGNTALAVDSLGYLHVVYTGSSGFSYLTNRPD